MNFFPETSDAARLFMAFYWGIFFHHYYLDQKIWRFQADGALRRELGASSAMDQGAPHAACT
mgnify:CR=1 FL=1